MPAKSKTPYLDIILVRQYHRTATNGTIYINGDKQCHTIERPWRQNMSRISCIPEGRYQLVKRKSLKFGDHIQLLNVPGRDLILIHPANNAVKELKGCIAPVTDLTAPGFGTQSRSAFIAFRDKVYSFLNDGLPLWITITSEKEINNELQELAGQTSTTTFKIG